MKAISHLLEALSVSKGEASNVKSLLEEFSDVKCVLMCNERSIQVIPLKKGINPRHFSLLGSAKYFLVDESRGAVEKITLQQVEPLLFQMPWTLSAASFDPMKVNQFLVSSRKSGVWGDLSKIQLLSWEDWSCFFYSTKNAVMIPFMQRALKYQQIAC